MAYPPGTPALPAAVERSGRVAVLLSEPPVDGSSYVLLPAPRPPDTRETLGLVTPTTNLDVLWMLPTGNTHSIHLWLSPEPVLPPVSEGELVIDQYSGSFVRARALPGLDLTTDRWFSIALADAGNVGPLGTVIPTTAALSALGGVVWYDESGTLGHVKGIGGADLPSTEAATMIDGGALLRGHHDLTDPAHPALIITEVFTQPEERRLHMADLLAAMDAGEAFTITLDDPGARFVASGFDVITEPAAPLPVYASVAELRALLNAPNGQEAEDRLAVALYAASRWVDYKTTGTTEEADVELPLSVFVVPARTAIKTATLAVAVRLYQSPNVPYGVAGGLGDLAVFVRTSIPDVELALLGQRSAWGVG